MFRSSDIGFKSKSNLNRSISYNVILFTILMIFLLIYRTFKNKNITKHELSSKLVDTLEYFLPIYVNLSIVIIASNIYPLSV